MFHELTSFPDNVYSPQLKHMPSLSYYSAYYSPIDVETLESQLNIGDSYVST